MKKVSVVAVGKIKENFVTEGIAEYAKRLSRFCEFDIKIAPESAAQDTAEEENGLLSLMNGYNILTDPSGKEISSNELAEIIKDALIKSDRINFIVGSSKGVSDAVKKQSDKIISFGKMTFPHRLFRLILTEQIYRAFTIMAGLPYHK